MYAAHTFCAPEVDSYPSSFTLAGGDVFQTIPGTYAFYKRQWVNRKLSPACFFYAVARYMTIISLVTNGIGFYGTHFTPATCQPFYMLPNVTAMLAGMAVQILVFIRYVRVISTPVWHIYVLIDRVSQPLIKNGGCKGRVNHANEGGYSYYGAHMTYDLIAVSTATFFLVYSSQISGVLWVVLEFLGLIQTGAASSLSLAIVLIVPPPAIQHLILGTQGLVSNNDTGLGSSQSRSPNKSRYQSAIVFGAGDCGQAIELQSSVFVQSRMDDSQTSRAPTDKGSNPNKEDVV
ncbi:hypothetical protein C8R44DRAFT_929027 [Mycena epipterygia]|nr:hypothetical protein C8R44DRAFT_929027 [Mycena epipterygia]